MEEKMLTWKDFESTTDNARESFENLCRLFFKLHFIKNKSANVNQKANNPGIETEPFLINGESVGFQAKYFSKDVSYSDILDSAQKTVKYYNGKIQKVILFCNQKINIDATNYIAAVDLLAKNNIKLEAFCDVSILDTINLTEEYSIIRALFFNRITLKTEWFNKKLNEALQDLSPRYTSGFHVDMEDAQKHFEILYRTEKVFEMLAAIKGETIDGIRALHSIDTQFQSKIMNTINALPIPNWDNINDVYLWMKEIEPFELEIHHRLSAITDEIDELYKDDSDKNKKKIDKLRDEKYELNQLLYIIDSLDLSQDSYFKCLNSNLMILEGDAGCGKSHLLGYEAELHGNNGDCRSILLLGHKFVLRETPQKQIMSLLGLDNVTFEQFIKYCEGLGFLYGTTTVIMIDAINECQESSIWRTYLNTLFEQVQKCSYVKIVCSIRTTYKQHFFEEKIKKDIAKGVIPSIALHGFVGILEEAIPLFFNHYKIPIETSDYFNREFENPLFLKIYCETYQHNQSCVKFDIYALFNCLFKQEEEKIKSVNQIMCEIEYYPIIMNVIGEYFYSNNTSLIPLEELSSKLKNYEKIWFFIDGFLKSKILVSYKTIEGSTNVYLGYEKFSDYIVANHILSRTKNKAELKKYVRKHFLQVNKYGDFRSHFTVGRFAALSALFRLKYNKELIIYVGKAITKLTNYSYEALVSEYINAFKFRNVKAINANDYFNIIGKKYVKTDSILGKYIDLLISMAGINCELNANALTAWLNSKTLASRDRIWTCYINNNYYQGSHIFYLVQFFLKNKTQDIKSSTKLLYGQLLIWFFSSSNRKLRDEASRALVNLLENDLATAYELLKIYIQVNDPYIISRLFGCIYGAILLSDRLTISKEKYTQIADFIYKEIFKKQTTYTDILLRDYALNILEYACYLNIPINFEISECRPPYKSSNFPNISIKKLKKIYKDDYKDYGLYAIKDSMYPEHGLSGFSGMYGDFGRYTFESSMYGFKDIDKQQIFKYAYYYIVKKLGYKSKLFSQYDKTIGHGRSRGGNTERIGKKYQWITMYHVLALITDHYQYEEKYSDAEYLEYKGSWRPYVRDFDPTLRLTSRNDRHKLGCVLKREVYSNWDELNLEWAKNGIDGCSHKKIIEMSDNNGQEWVALYFSETDRSNPNYDKTHQELWKSSVACLVHRNEKESLISNLKDKNFFGRWFEAAEPIQRYSVFAHEYPWSPAYKEEINGIEFNHAKVKDGYQKVIKKTPMAKFFKRYNTVSDDYIDEDMYLEEDEVAFDEPIYKEIGKILPCISFYLWEEGCDYAKEESISYTMPIKFIVDKLDLIQMQDGIWFKNKKLACVEFGLVDGSNFKNALFIKKELLKELLGDELDIVWIGIGEKRHIIRGVKSGQVWNELSSLAFYNEDNLLQEINNSKVTEQ